MSRSLYCVRAAQYRCLYCSYSCCMGAKICCGLEKPAIAFDVEATPPSAFISWIIRQEMRDALLEELKLPDGVSLCPIRVLEGDDPLHLITLNVYRVSGITNGLRAEWNVFVKDQDGGPRFMVVEALASGGSMDSVDGFTPPMPLSYEHSGDDLHIRAGADSVVLDARFSRNDTRGPSRRGTDEWIAASDRVYWRNGVYDEVAFNSTLPNAPLRDIDPAKVTLDNKSPWSRFVEPDPVHVLLYDAALHFMVVPWSNFGNAPLARRGKHNEVRSPISPSTSKVAPDVRAGS